MEKYLVIDTETTGGLAYPIAYDVGGVVVDNTGYIYERFHWAVLEIIGNPAKMATAFYAEKMPEYWREVYAQNIRPLPFADILRKITALIDFHDIKKIAAYNMAFDKRAMANTAYEIFDNRNWLNRPAELLCIWNGACTSIMDTDKYIKWCVQNGYISDKDNPRTSAEVCFRYITGQTDFVEEHTGGRDAEIEAAILTAILRRKKPADMTIKGSPWRVPANRYHEMLAAGKLGKIRQAVYQMADLAADKATPGEVHHYQKAHNRVE